MESPNSTVIYYENCVKWYLNSALHRKGAPAIVYNNGTKHWFLYGRWHRENGPAAEYANGTKIWYLGGRRHRVGGPAIEHPDGTKYWALDGKMYSKKEYDKEVIRWLPLKPINSKDSEPVAVSSKEPLPVTNMYVTIDGKKYKLSEV